ncbi:hypothetical protein ACG33_14785 [Steroidobacter denitrificans]|uniref:NAD-dependent epimerase/dehydratase domain-containing protein n=1 Tax=Steroidobacter denitrificans TaxID=465721 RepID=A0A127FEN9_STEDE|nr:NAD-dependent epimerase/dehydratase family protein [Steroidobacter denitrificans]AMN48338.1 hypothetical protein ACG33_14785 [Steroidobacter denitrificans]
MNDTQARPRILVAGCGYVGRRLLSKLEADHEVIALVRSAASAAALAARGTHVLGMDLDLAHSGRAGGFTLHQEIGQEPDDRFDFLIDHPIDQDPEWDDGRQAPVAILYLIPPQRQGESDLRLDRFLQRLGTPPQCFIYISSTGVYGDTGGGLVDESTPVQPRSERARRRISAEEMIRVWCHERHVRRVVLRAGGIYGPGRLPLEALRRGEPVVQEQDSGISNHIHVDDLAEACLAALSNHEACGIYNISDGQPLSSGDFYLKVARASGLPDPPRVSMDEAQLTFTPQRLSFLAESRRVDNRRMLTHLGVKLKYTDPDAGIRASLQETI